MDGTISEIRLWAANFAPYNWALCDGRLLLIRENTALYALLGTQFGGDGVTTFALPNLCGRTLVGARDIAGDGQPQLAVGQTGGVETVTLTAAQLAPHTHTIQASTNAGTLASPQGAYPAGAHGQDLYGPPTDTAMHLATVAPAGGSLPHENMMPFLGLNYIICLRGYFPYRP